VGEKSLFERLGGRITLDKVHKDFYDYLYEDPVLSFYFKHVEQDFIEKTQSDFMGVRFGGPPEYRGLGVKDAHSYMFIKPEHLELRQVFLKKALVKNGVAEDLMEEWLKIDHAFWQQIEKKDLSDCKKRYTTQEFLIPPSLARGAEAMKLPTVKTSFV